MKNGAKPEFRVVTLRGHTLRVAIWKARGSKRAARPLLFFNGIGANIEVIAPFAERLGNRDIVTFDMPGVGGSPSPSKPYRLWMMAQIARDLLDQLGYHKVDVMGVSWGGAMAQQFAFQYGKRVEKLILCATMAGVFAVPGRWSALSKMLSPQRYIDEDYMKRHFSTIYGGSAQGSDGHASRTRAPTKSGYLAQLFAISGWNSAPFLPFISAKTLILAGEVDALVPPVNGMILKTLMPGSELHVIKNGGHLFLITQMDETIELIEEFLADEVALKAAA